MTRPPNPGLADSLLAITTTIHCSFADRRRLFEAPRLRASDELDAAVAAAPRPGRSSSWHTSATPLPTGAWSTRTASPGSSTPCRRPPRWTRARAALLRDVRAASLRGREGRAQQRDPGRRRRPCRRGGVRDAPRGCPPLPGREPACRSGRCLRPRRYDRGDSRTTNWMASPPPGSSGSISVDTPASGARRGPVVTPPPRH